MHERQAHALFAFYDRVSAGCDLAAARAIQARAGEHQPIPFVLSVLGRDLVTEHEPIPYTLSPAAETLLTAATPRLPGRFKRLLDKAVQVVCAAIDENLYGRELAIIRSSQAELDRIAGRTAKS